MRRIVGLAVAAALCGCSTGMSHLSSTWDGLSVPRCTDSYLPVVGDMFVGGLLLGMGVSASDGTGGTYDSLALAGIVSGVVFAIDSGIATGAVLQCKAAQAKARFRGAIEQTASHTTVFCFQSGAGAGAMRCARSAEACASQRDAAVAGATDASTIGDCAEVK